MTALTTVDPGPALDAEIGRILDCEQDFRCPSCDGTWFGTWDTSAPYDQWVRVCHGPPAACGWKGSDSDCMAWPRFSTDIAAAWTVVERLRSKQVDVMLLQGEPQVGRGPADQWECALWWHENGEHRETTQYADTAPLAICRAALKVAL